MKISYVFIVLAVTAMMIACLAGSASATVMAIDSVITSGDTLESITVGSTTYSVLTSPTSITDNSSTLDVIHKDATAPADLAAAIGDFDLGNGSLNASYEAQFGGALADDSLIFLFNNDSSPRPGDSATVYAIDENGNQLGADSGTINFRDFWDAEAETTMPELVGSTSYHRTTGGSSTTGLSRVLVGVAFTLTDLGLDGLGATGIEISTSTVDTQAVGLAAVPEPSSVVLALGGFLALGVIAACRKRR